MEGWIRPLRSDRLSAAGGSYGGKQGGGRDTAAAKKDGSKAAAVIMAGLLQCDTNYSMEYNGHVSRLFWGWLVSLPLS